MKSPHSLVGRPSEWLSAREGGKPSLIWRSLIWRKEILELVMRWRVGNGLFINVKSDKWLPQPTTFKVISPDASLWNLKVSDCIDENKQWKVPFIQSKILDFEENKAIDEDESLGLQRSGQREERRRENGKFGTGAIFRDENGKCLSVLASLGDAQIVFAALDSSLEDDSVDGALIEEAKFFISLFLSCTQGFVSRDGNIAAHTVARDAISYHFPTYWWQLVLEWLGKIVDDDSSL
ncbi:hypothetical protein ACLB2K_073124 [Fragaria x ananassa]